MEIGNVKTVEMQSAGWCKQKEWPEAKQGAIPLSFRPLTGASGQASRLALLGERLVKIECQ